MAGTISSFPITTKGWSDFPLNTNPLDTDLIMGRSGASTSPMTLETSKQAHGGIIPWTSGFSFLAGNYTDRNGLIYRAKQNNSNQDPALDISQTYWEAISTALQQGRRNVLINGNFDIWERGDSQTTIGYGSDDRWYNDHQGSTKIHSRQSFTLGQSDVPGNPTYFSRTVVTSVAGNSNYVSKEQKIEDVTALAGQTVTISFNAKADSNKDIAVEFSQVFGTGGTPSATVNGIGVTTISLTSTWSRYTATITLPPLSGKTLGDNNDYLGVRFWFDAGSDYDSRTNSLGQQSGTFDISRVQLEEGDYATPFEDRPLYAEEKLCRRYTWKLPGTPIILAGARVVNSSSTGVITSAQISTTISIPKMRTTPTITNILANDIDLRTQSGGLVTTMTSVPTVSSTGQNLLSCTFSSADISNVTQIRFEATSPIFDAEIYN